jgi:lipopolysaccharide transport system permease protein
LLWALLAPLAMVAIYSAVFQGVFKARWADSAVGGIGYALRLFAGLIVFSAASEVAGRATRLMQDNANLVKRVVFPLELLCVALVMQVAVHLGLQLAVLGVLQVLVGDGIGTSIVRMLVAVPWLLALMLTLALLLSAVGCYLRDLQHMVPLMMSGLMFLSPVLYPASAAPAPLAALLSLNPMTGPIEMLRAAWFGTTYAWADAALPIGLTLLALWLAHRLFVRLRPGFADLV